jgi:hypothetical protein
MTIERNGGSAKQGWYCGQCREPLVEERRDSAVDESHSCPHCGATVRTYKATLAASVETRAYAKIKGRRGGKGRPFVLITMLQQWWHDGGKLVQRVYRVDHERKRYTETVVDPDTGAVIHHKDKPLSEHHSSKS